MNRIETLTSLRFFMIMLIVLSHFSFFSTFEECSFIYDVLFKNPCLSVDFFFILSGFGMMYSFLNKGNDCKKISVVYCVKYAIKHIKKIYPVYIISILACLPLYFFNVVSGRIFIENFTLSRLLQFLLTIPLLQSLPGMVKYSHFGNGVCWFLSALFCIYIASPLLLKILAKIDRPKLVIAAIGASFVFIILERFFFGYIESVSHFDDLVYGSPYCRIFYVGIGMLFARYFCLTHNYRSCISSKLELFLTTLLFLFVMLKNLLSENFFSFSLVMPYVSILIAGAVCYVFAFEKGCVSSLLRKKQFVLLGELSMFIFLIHYPIITYLKIILKIIGFQSNLCANALIAILTLGFTFLLSHKLLKRKREKH